jgi:hypothetical protein
LGGGEHTVLVEQAAEPAVAFGDTSESAEQPGIEIAPAPPSSASGWSAS